MPATWKAANSYSQYDLADLPRDRFFLKYDKKLILLRSITFTKAYRIMQASRLQKVDFSHATTVVLTAYRSRTGISYSPSTLWKSVRNDHSYNKAGDLLWRLLHNKVQTGRSLEWLPTNLQLCPFHGCDFTADYIWISCSVAESIWQDVAHIWQQVSDDPVLIQRFMNEL
jgi:hypothetical protein